MYRTLFDPDEIPADIREFFEETSAQCGKPWVRVTERSFVPQLDSPMQPKAGNKGLSSPGWETPRGTISATTTGWSLGCQCNAEVAPCVVLDPFSGAGTALLVADRLGRDAIGIDLSHAYVEMARERLTQDCPLFTDISCEETERRRGNAPVASEDAYDRDMRDLFAEAAE